MNGINTSEGVSYDDSITHTQAVRQVMLGHSETEHQKRVRLAHMVLASWRRPVFRRLFEERLVEALHYVSEANEISKQMIASEKSSGVNFTIHLTCAVRLDDASSLSLREIIKYEYVQIIIRAVELENNADGTVMQEVIFECPRIAFGEFLDNLRNDYQAMRKFCILQTPTAGGVAYASAAAEIVRLGEESDNEDEDEGEGEKEDDDEENEKEKEKKILEKAKITVGQFREYILTNFQSAVESNELLDDCIEDELDHDWTETSEIGFSDICSIIDTLKRECFEQCLKPMIVNFGTNSAGNRASQKMAFLENLMQKKGEVLESIGNNQKSKENIFGLVHDEIKRLGDEVDVSLNYELLNKEEDVAEEQQNHGEDTFYSRDRAPSDLTNEESNDSYGSQNEEDDSEHHGEDDGGVDDWKLVHDESTGRDYWWSESRDQAEWVEVVVGDESEEEEAEEEMGEEEMGEEEEVEEEEKEEEKEQEEEVEEVEEEEVEEEEEEEEDEKDEEDNFRETSNDEWELIHDEASGKDYYWNSISETARWVN